MMQMLHAGGIPVAFDHSRPPDEHNPRGYYELNGGKIINRLIDGTFDQSCYQGQVVKITSYGLKFLPEGKYQILYMIRNIDEVLASMQKMGADIDKVRDRRLLGKLNRISLDWMRNRSDMNYLTIRYPDLIENPQKEMERISDFWGTRFDIQRAIKAVDSNLYRNRIPPGSHQKTKR